MVAPFLFSDFNSSLHPSLVSILLRANNLALSHSMTWFFSTTLLWPRIYVLMTATVFCWLFWPQICSFFPLQFCVHWDGYQICGPFHQCIPDHSIHDGRQYKESMVLWSSLLSFRWTRVLRRVVWGLLAAATLYDFITLLTFSVTPLTTRNQFDMYSFVSQSWCAFWQKNDMLLKWSIVKSTTEPKPQRKAYHLKDTSLLCDI